MHVQSNSVITPSKGPNKLCRYKSITVSEVCGQIVGEILYNKMGPAGVLFTVNAVISFKFKSNFNFRSVKLLFYFV